MVVQTAEGDNSIQILYVDDDRKFAEMVATFLKNENDQFTIETVTNATDGLGYLTDSSVDCVISDYDMPAQNGLEFLKTLREEHPNLPFILYTGKGSEEVASDAIAAGATDYLQKESGTDQYTVLANRIETAVERAHAKTQQQRQVAAIEAAQEGIAFFDADGYHVNVNQAYANTYRTSADELIGEHWNTLYPDSEVEQIRAHAFPHVEEHGNWRGRVTGLRADGTTFTQSCVISATEHDTTICTVQDVSDQLTSEKQLNRYRTLVEALDDPIYVLDEEGKFTFVNQSFAETFGYDVDEIVGSNISMVKTETAIKQGEANLGKILSSDGPDSVYFETEIQSKHGDVIPCEDHMAALPYEGESFEGSVGVLRDISEQKQREQELQRRNERLDEFAGIVSHDLRNPLSTAQGYLEAVQEDVDDQRLSIVAEELDRANDIVDDLLTLSRQGKVIDKDLEPVKLNSLITQCWQTIDEADATLEITTDQTVYADQSLLAQVIENLFQNAIDHGSESVHITVGALSDGFYIADDGPGIPENERETVLEHGYSTADGNTGFGLSIVQDIVTAHGWELAITESDTGGTRFEITADDFTAE